MLYSPDRGFIFIAVPKTGTTAIQDFLLGMDPNIMKNALPDGQGNIIRVNNHVTVGELRKLLGQQAEKLRIVAFMRDPRDVIRSKYHFYRTGRAAREALSDFAEAKSELIFRTSRLKKLGRVAIAKLLPLPLWATLYPFKSSAHFIDAPPSRIAVDYLGRFEHLAEDFRTIFSEFGYDPKGLVLPVVNETIYVTDPAEDALLERIARRRLSRDVEIFTQLSQWHCADYG